MNNRQQLKQPHPSTLARVKAPLTFGEGYPQYYHESNREPENLFLTIRLTPEQMARLKATAEQMETTKTALIKKLIFSILPE